MSVASLDPSADPVPWDLMVRAHGTERVRGGHLADVLAASGVRVWFDRQSILPSEAWLRAIDHGVTRTGRIAILVGPRTPPEWIVIESKLAVLHGRNESLGPLAVIVGDVPPDHTRTLNGASAPVRLSEDVDRWPEEIAPITEGVAASRAQAVGDPVSIEAELARVFDGEAMAKLLLDRAGFPPERIPSWVNSMVFWNVILEEVRRGVSEGGLSSLMEAAAVLYPDNSVFRLARGSSESRDSGCSSVRNSVEPYPGLGHFDVSTSHYFFGRDEQLRECIAQLDAAPGTGHSWLQITGSSGSGKSSLARAGIVPAVLSGALSRREAEWRVAVHRPGQRPLESLAKALVEAFGRARFPRPGALIERLHREPGALGTVLDEHLEPGTSLLLVVDQLEEVLTVVTDPREREGFDEALAAVVRETQSCVLVTTIRSDFFARFIEELPALTQVFKAHASLYPLSPLSTEGLLSSIQGPARLVGLEWDDRLPERIAKQTQGNTGCLPLIAHVLRSIWAHSTNQRLTHADYDGVGGMGGALAKDADQLVNDLDDDDKEFTRRILLRLVKVPNTTGAIGGPAAREDVLLATGAERAVAERVLSRLSGAQDPYMRQPLPRLVVVTRQPGEGGEERVELMHEALISRWPRLRAWIELERARLSCRDMVETMASRWNATGRSERMLASPIMLESFAGEGLDRLTEFLSSIAREYLRLSSQAAVTGGTQGRGEAMPEDASVHLQVRAFRHALLGPVQGLSSAARLLLKLAREQGDSPLLQKCEVAVETSREEIRLWRANQRLFFSRNVGVDIVPQSLRPVIERSLKRYQSLLHMRSIDALLDWRTPEEIEFSFDAQDIDLALSNFLDLARQKSATGHEIRVVVESDGASFKLSVEYVGQALPESIVEELLQMETSTDPGVVDMFIGGPAFGLAMARRVALCYGGTTRQHSERVDPDDESSPSNVCLTLVAPTRGITRRASLA